MTDNDAVLALDIGGTKMASAVFARDVVETESRLKFKLEGGEA